MIEENGNSNVATAAIIDSDSVLPKPTGSSKQREILHHDAFPSWNAFSVPATGNYQVWRFGNESETSQMNGDLHHQSYMSSGIYPIPSYDYHHHCSERVTPYPPFGGCKARIQIGGGSKNPFLNSNDSTGLALPSKWEDAERWIFSPWKPHEFPHHHCIREPKSKSGPLTPPGFIHQCSSSSSTDESLPAFGSVNVTYRNKLVDSSPFLNTEEDVVKRHTNQSMTNIPRSVSVHGWCSEVAPVQTINPIKAADTACKASRRDVATQMSSNTSSFSSPGRTISFMAISSSTSTVMERDVQADENKAWWCNKNETRERSNLADACWDISDTAKFVAQLKREEAKMYAWENLQKAKAEMAICRLEMKLEKKRSSSMEKITEKLRHAEKKAQEMRSSVRSDEKPRCSSGRLSITGCFTCSF